MSPNTRGVVWAARPIGQYPQAYITVNDDGEIQIAYHPDPGPGLAFVLNRRLARLVARRINQALDQTGKGHKRKDPKP